MRNARNGGGYKSVDEDNTKIGVTFYFQPLIEFHENVVHVNLLQHPQVGQAEVLPIVFDVILDEGVHVFDQDVHWGFLD